MDFVLPVAKATCSFSKDTFGHRIFTKIIGQLKDKVLLGSLFEAIRHKAEAYTVRCEYCKAGRAFSNFAEACADPIQAAQAWNSALGNYDLALSAIEPKKHLARLKICSGILRAQTALASHYSRSVPKQDAFALASISAIGKLVLEIQNEAGSLQEKQKTRRYGKRVIAESLRLQAIAAKFFAGHYFEEGTYPQALKSARQAYQMAVAAGIAFMKFRLSGGETASTFHSIHSRHARKMERESELMSAECSLLEGDCHAKLGEHDMAALQYRIAGIGFSSIWLEEEHAVAKGKFECEVKRAKAKQPLYRERPFPEFETKSKFDGIQRFFMGGN